MMNVLNRMRMRRAALGVAVACLLVVAEGVRAAGQVVVANRASGNVSIIDVDTDIVLDTVALPFDATMGEVAPQAMYVVHLPDLGQVAVGDRANSRVVFFDQRDWSVVDTVATGAGLFHMDTAPGGNQLWVVNDVDRSLTVIDALTKTVTTTIDVSGVAMDDQTSPHDVIVGPAGDSAFVTFGTPASGTDLLVKFSAATFAEVDRTDIPDSTHISVNTDGLVYLAAQSVSEVQRLDAMTLDFVDAVMGVPNAHGADLSPDGSYFYTTNIAGGGTDGLFAYDTALGAIVGDLGGVDTPFAVPHNLVVTGDGGKLYITHSGGTSNKVSVYDLSDPATPVLLGSLDMGGLNPFGLAYIAPIPTPTAAAGGAALFGLIAMRRRKRRA